MSREHFGTDGIRGQAGIVPLTPEIITKAGLAVGTYFARNGGAVCIGRDTRESSGWIANALTDGFVAAGMDVIDLGVVPTPAVSYLTNESGADAGAMITASHNPYQDNGIKFFTGGGDKLTDDAEAEIGSLINSDLSSNGRGRRYENLTRVFNYLNFVADSAGTDFDGLSIALDTANGAASGHAAYVFKRLGAGIVVPMFDQPNGQNINDTCGATNTAALRKMITDNSDLQIGAAFDGDADRIMMVDELGREIDGDILMYINAVSRGEQGIVSTVMSNKGLETALKRNGITMVRADVGDRYVLQGLADYNLTLGGEQSGHLIYKDFLATGDGMLAAVQTIRHLRESGKTLAEWRDEVPILPQKLVNFSVTDKSILQRPDIQEYIQSEMKRLGEAGRVLIRPSGTEQKIRVMVESDDAADRAQTIADNLQALFAA